MRSPHQSYGTTAEPGNHTMHQIRRYSSSRKNVDGSIVRSFDGKMKRDIPKRILVINETLDGLDTGLEVSFQQTETASDESTYAKMGMKATFDAMTGYAFWIEMLFERQVVPKRDTRRTKNGPADEGDRSGLWQKSVQSARQ